MEEKLSDLSLEQLKDSIDRDKLPAHIAIIMDGNGRWANAKNLPRIEGHRRGAERLQLLLDTLLELKIPYVSLYVFSTENWKRPEQEIKALFELLERHLKKNLKDFVKNEIRLHVSGEYSALPAKTVKLIENALEKTKTFSRMTVNFCLNYGSRNEIIRAMQRFAETTLSMNDRDSILSSFQNLDDEKFASYLDTASLPEVDLLIRTAGEQRLSNFLLWQSAYAELYFTEKNWPDFDEEEVYLSLHSYQSRIRKFGGLS